LGPSRVRIAQADAFALEAVEGRFSAAFAGFLWSHVRRRDISRFLTGLHARMGAGSRIVFADNRCVPGSSTPVARRDAEGDTYQLRKLADGSEHEVVKNFPSADELRASVRAAAERVEITELTYYWCLSYVVRSEPG
jgi:demethylmenaquinone methyltransferase/2-methoxy-6-polyprenyl-1,4-benzoquinol methylase